MKSFYEGMNEYRLEKLTSTQGHYILRKDLRNALRVAKARATTSHTPYTVQRWKPMRGKQIYIVMSNYQSTLFKTKSDIIKFYKGEGYNVSHIRDKKFVISRRRLY